MCCLPRYLTSRYMAFWRNSTWLGGPSTGRGWLPASGPLWPVLPCPFQVLWSGGSLGTLPHTLVGRWEQTHVGLSLFWLSPDSGWRFSLGNWWQSQRKSSFLLCNLEKSNLSSQVSPSVERLCEICTNGCVRGKGLTAKLPALYWSFEIRSWVLCTLWWKKGKVLFHENDLLYSDLLTWVKANLNMTSIYCTIRKTEVMHNARVFLIKNLLSLFLHYKNLHILSMLPSRNDGSVFLLTLQLLFLWRVLTLEEAYKHCWEQQR